MDFSRKEFCRYCAMENCEAKDELLRNENCIFNFVIFENERKVLFYNIPNKSIYLIENGEGIKELNFKDAIREIDIIPTKTPDWKRFQILNLARDLGVFGAIA